MDQATQQEQALGLPPGSRGRSVDEGEPEKAVKLSSVKQKIGTLMRSYRRMVLAGDDFRERANKIGEETNCKPATLRRLVRVSYRGKFGATVAGMTAERDLFEAVGEVPGGDGAE